MNLILQIREIKNKISGQILFDESLSKYSWFNLGGPAKVIFKPKNLNELSFFLKKAKGFDKIKVLGAGSNTLIWKIFFSSILI
jgi:UDP-N-acetylmuramate dehydrogenase